MTIDIARPAGVAASIVITPLILIPLLKWLGKKMPSKPLPATVMPTVTGKFTTGDWIALFFTLGALLGAIFAMAYGANLLQLNLVDRLANQNYRYLLTPGWPPFSFPAMLIVVPLVSMYGQKLADRMTALINRESLETVSVRNSRQNWAGLDLKKFSRWLFIIFAPLSILTALPLFENYILITDTGIIINKIIGIGETFYPWSSINRIVYIDKYRNKVSGEITSTTPQFYVLMKDGATWNTLNSELNDTPRMEEIMLFISTKSAVEIKSGIHNIDDISP